MMNLTSFHFNARVLLFFAVLFASATMLFPFPVTITIHPDQDRAPISPYIYGTNQPLSGEENWTAYRQGGNRLTGYNWENNASTAGTDWNNNSDNYMTWTRGISGVAENAPGIAITSFHDSNLIKNAYSLITLQMAGYVAKDKNGVVGESETAPSNRWVAVKNIKGSAFLTNPSLTDSAVYMDELTHFLVNRYGGAAAPNGIKGYSLDNEPALWPSTHPRIHPDKPSCTELLTKSIGLSIAIRGEDPDAEIFGPVAYGFAEYMDFQGASDWNSVKGNTGWFLSYYLDRMKKASDSIGSLLLNVLDVHWYSEARGNGERIVQAGNPANRDNAMARIQAPRTLWDSSYVEESWIGEWNSPVALIPHMQASINRYFPGTGIAFTEYNYGGENHVSGGLAMADVLGIFGKYGVYFASWWQMESISNYVSAALKLFRNYDGNRSTFGDIHVQAATDDDSLSSVYASVVSGNGNVLHLVVMNKNFDDTLRGSFSISGNRDYTSGNVWGFGPSFPTLTELPSVAGISGNTFTYNIPPLFAVHIVLSDNGSGTEMAGGTIKAFILEVCPQPFKTSGTIKFQTETGVFSRLYILDCSGKVVRDFGRVIGNGRVTWNGKNEHGKEASGIYFAVLKSGQHTLQKRFALIR